ncbi:MAG: hypothetical protein EGP79_15610 [Roseburia intestinalis]|nr:hypothetical protein [Roseburia intestinalis]
MAILHIIDPPIHPGSGKRGTYAHLKSAINYILKPEKTLGGLYTGSCNCRCETALQEMIDTKTQYGKVPIPGTKGYENNRLAYHFIISWSPKEHVSPELAMEIVSKFCENELSDYEVVYSAHTDTKHMHAHIIFNSVNFKNGSKYRYNKNDWERKLQPLVDRLCKEQGLHELKDDTGKTLSEYAAERKITGKKKRHPDSVTGSEKIKPSDNVTGSNGYIKEQRTHGNRKYVKRTSEEYSMSDYLRDEIDSLIMSCKNFEEFEQCMKDAGYDIKYGNSERYGKYMAVCNSEMQRFRRTHTLGEDYTLSMIKKRIELFHSELPQNREKTSTESWILISKKIYYCSFSYDIKNPYLRRQYARLYRLGIISNYEKRPSYRETKKRIEQLRKIEYQIDLITKNSCFTLEQLDDAINEGMDELKGLKDEKKEHKLESQTYQKEWSVYEQLEKLEGGFLLFKEGNEVFETEAIEYQKLKDMADHFSHTKEELRNYLENETVYEKEMKARLCEKRKQLEAMRELKEDYQRVMEEYTPADDEMLNRMNEHGVGAVSESIKGRKRDR